MTTDSTTLKRHVIRKIFRKHRGAAAQLARELDVRDSTIAGWLKGRFDSARIREAAEAKAREFPEAAA